MTESLETRYRSLLDAAGFAARAHQGQKRKDERTPYVSHVFRVCLIVRDVFEIDDARTLTTALLHDTIEDTTTDYDELAARFGPEVADWVALLSKDKRRPEEEREKAYLEQLARAPWQVQACKLADIFDNLMDAAGLSPEQRAKSLRRARAYLTSLGSTISPALKRAHALVSQLVLELS
jgi:(p)ppGpp synthase/HD superfamily hydrolase